MSHLPQLSLRACRSWACSQEGVLFVIISAQRAVRPPGDTEWCLDTSVLVTLELFLTLSGLGPGILVNCPKYPGSPPQRMTWLQCQQN